MGSEAPKDLLWEKAFFSACRTWAVRAGGSGVPGQVGDKAGFGISMVDCGVVMCLSCVEGPSNSNFQVTHGGTIDRYQYDIILKTDYGTNNFT